MRVEISCIMQAMRSFYSHYHSDEDIINEGPSSHKPMRRSKRKPVRRHLYRDESPSSGTDSDTDNNDTTTFMSNTHTKTKPVIRDASPMEEIVEDPGTAKDLTPNESSMEEENDEPMSRPKRKTHTQRQRDLVNDDSDADSLEHHLSAKEKRRSALIRKDQANRGRGRGKGEWWGG